MKCKYLLSSLEWLEPVVITLEVKWKIFPFFSENTHAWLFGMGGFEITVSKSLPSYLQTWRQPSPIVSWHLYDSFCQMALPACFDGTQKQCLWRFLMSLLFGGGWTPGHCGSWLVGCGWWLYFAWGCLTGWLNMFGWVLECSGEDHCSAKDIFASHSCSCSCKVCFEPRWQEEGVPPHQFKNMETLRGGFFVCLFVYWILII